MIASFVQLDRVLRGEIAHVDRLALSGVAPVVVVLGMVNGACMGLYALVNRDPAVWMQLVASSVKVPALFLLTLIVTFPSLYVFSALMGSGLRGLSTLRMIGASLGVTMALLASFGPIVAFFSLSTANYSFMVLVNVITYGAAGGFGLAFLLRSMRSVIRPPAGTPAALPAASDAEASADEVGTEKEAPGEHGDATARHSEALVRLLFRIWVVVFGIVGAQMAWVLRPFIGDPAADFTWFRPRGSSFFEAVWTHVIRLL